MQPVIAEILVSVAKTFLVMAVGVVFRRFWARDVSAINDLAMQLFVPSLAFSAILNERLALSQYGGVAVAAVLVVSGVLLVSVTVFRLAHLRSRGLLLAAVFANTANLPFPILEANFGQTGLSYGVIYYLVNQSLMFSFGIMLVARTADLRSLLRVPVFPTTILALALVAFHVPVPAVVRDTADLLGQAAIPLILFAFGYSLAGVHVGAWRTTALVAALRLVGGFAAGYAAAALLGLTGVERDVVILVATMPSAVINVAISLKYRSDPELVASVVLTTTVAAIGIVPLMLIWLRT